MKTKAPLTAEQALAKKKKGYLIVRYDGEPPWKWRSKLRLALRDCDRANEAWGLVLYVVDCATKQRVYEFRSLGVPR